MTDGNKMHKKSECSSGPLIHVLSNPGPANPALAGLQHNGTDDRETLRRQWPQTGSSASPLRGEKMSRAVDPTEPGSAPISGVT